MNESGMSELVDTGDHQSNWLKKTKKNISSILKTQKYYDYMYFTSSPLHLIWKQ